MSNMGGKTKLRNGSLSFFIDRLGQQPWYYYIYISHVTSLSESQSPVICVQLILKPVSTITETRPRGYKAFFLLISAEHGFVLLINVKMPRIVAILSFILKGAYPYWTFM